MTVKDEAGYKNDFLPKIQPVIKENGGVDLLAAHRDGSGTSEPCGSDPLR